MGRLKLAAVFSDKCVLQRGKSIVIFGSGEENAVVEAVLSGKVLGQDEEQEGRGRAAVKDGRFELYLPALRAGLDHTLTVTDGETTVVLRDIAIGEVWLAGGQSNMELELQNCAERDALDRPADRMLRFYYTQKRAYMDEDFFRSEEETAWECFGDSGTRCWSAVGYFFGDRLKNELQVPVGIIGCNWGGTSASAWIPEEALEEDRELDIYLDIYRKATEGRTEEQQLREYREYTVLQAEYDKRMEALYREHPDMEWDKVEEILGENRYPGPLGCSNPCRPCGLYDCMVRRVLPYTLKGFIYYQGESDDHLPHLYYKLFSRLIRQWREDWGDDELPFLFVQLPMHRYRQDPDFKNWCLIREAQDRVYRTVRNTGMACAIDQGEFNEIHPKAKKAIGERLCAQALEIAYGREAQDAEGPRFAWAEPGEGELVLHISGAADGLLYRSQTEEKNFSGQETGSFEVAGADGAYVPAEVTGIERKAGELCLHVRGEKIRQPVFARYLWTNYAQVYLFGRNGLPLAPFRTDRNDGFAVK